VRTVRRDEFAQTKLSLLVSACCKAADSLLIGVARFTLTCACKRGNGSEAQNKISVKPSAKNWRARRARLEARATKFLNIPLSVRS
jgi:hypothetical protein